MIGSLRLTWLESGGAAHRLYFRDRAADRAAASRPWSQGGHTGTVTRAGLASSDDDRETPCYFALHVPRPEPLISQPQRTPEADPRAAADAVRPRPPARRDRLLSLIALFKLFKATLLILVGLAAFQFVRPQVAERVEQWFGALPFTLAHHSAQRLLVWATGLSGRRVQVLGLAAFAYAALFTTEGIGLWWGRRWAEWLTIVATGSLIPFEIYEIFRVPHVTRFLALGLNVSIVIYLIYALRHRADDESAGRTV